MMMCSVVQNPSSPSSPSSLLGSMLSPTALHLNCSTDCDVLLLLIMMFHVPGASTVVMVVEEAVVDTFSNVGYVPNGPNTHVSLFENTTKSKSESCCSSLESAPSPPTPTRTPTACTNQCRGSIGGRRVSDREHNLRAISRLVDWRCHELEVLRCAIHIRKVRRILLSQQWILCCGSVSTRLTGE